MEVYPFNMESPAELLHTPHKTHLLEEHHQTGYGRTFEHRPSFEKCHKLCCLERRGASDVLREALCRDLLLEQCVRLDLEELELDKSIGFGRVAKVGEGFTGFVIATLAEEPAWTEGDPKASKAEA